MPTPNGKTYEMQYLTDEETAVINAMRMGAKVTSVPVLQINLNPTIEQ